MSLLNEMKAIKKSVGSLAVSEWDRRTHAGTTDNQWRAVCWSPELGLFAVYRL